ncbi:MAG: hypothetical protein FWF96_07620, partial [Kiritimatiellaeota bacterium]|nr:hypothetical protein [Kiritimatiellota bacterium]
MKKPVTRALPLFATLCMAGVAAAQNYVWLEGEKPTSSNYEGNPHGWGNSHFMSGGAWMHVSVDEGKIKDTVPEEGILFKYEFEAPAAGEYEVWARVGFEGIRSPIDWRVDNAEFQRTTADDLTTDLMEIAFWCELAWLQLGKAQLAAGKHTLEFRLPKIVAEDGKAQRIVFALDCACVSLEPFFPNSHWKPGEDWQSEKDKQAAEHVFKVPATAAGARAAVPLNGVWEVTRNDEQTPPADVAQPMVDFPAQFRWTAINVPSDKNKSRPDLVFAHRLWYRTRVDVPADMAGRGFALRFPENNLNTTVFVNGEQCGFFAYPFADFSVDITAAVKPGVNEIWVGIRDAWYGRSTNPDNPLKLRKTFNYPLGLFGQGFQDFAWPVWNHSQSGILQTPELLVMGGPVYASDMFAKPSVSKKQLAVEATIINPTKAAVNAVVALEAVNTKTGETEKKFAPVSVALAAGEEKMVEVAEAWANPKLWWPDEPNLYWIRATVTPVSPASPMSPDVSNTRFGFREWDWSTREFKLNGLTWNVWCDCFTAGSKEEWLKFYKEKNQTVMRFWGTTWLNGMHAREALDFMDENGVLCRRSGIFDGEAIGYWVIENDQVLKDLYDS